jgi:hypothetical protein
MGATLSVACGLAGWIAQTVREGAVIVRPAAPR